jgi:hypothetical protein
MKIFMQSAFQNSLLWLLDQLIWTTHAIPNIFCKYQELLHIYNSSQPK